MRIASLAKILVALLLCFATNATAIDLGKKLVGRMVGFPLNPPLDSAAGNIFKWPDSASVMVWAMGNDTGGTSSQAIYSARTTTVTAAGLAALGIRADSNGTNTPFLVFADSGVILNGGSTARQVVGGVYLWRANCPFVTPFTADFYADTLKDEVKTIGGTTQTARDLGASVLLSSGTGTGQLDFTSGVVKANMIQVLSNTPDTTGGTGRFRVNVGYIGGAAVSTSSAQLGVNVVNWNGSAVATPNVAGYPLVDLVKVQGTNTDTTGASGRLAVNMRYVAGALLSTSTAQFGVNVVNVGGTAQTARDLGASVLLSSGTGTGQISLTSGRVDVGKVSGTTQTALDLGAYLPAALDTIMLHNGYRTGGKAVFKVSANYDTLYIYSRDGTTLLFRTVFIHPGGSPGDPPDTSRAVGP